MIQQHGPDESGKDVSVEDADAVSGTPLLSDKIALFRARYLQLCTQNSFSRKTPEECADDLAKESVRRIEEWIDECIQGAGRRHDGRSSVMIPSRYVKTIGVTSFAVTITATGNVQFDDVALHIFNRNA